MVQVIAYVPVAVRERLQRATGTSGATNASIVLDAVDAIHSRLPELLRASAPARSEAGSLFAPRPVHRRTGPHVQVSMRAWSQDVAVLDDLARRHNTSRSALIAAALSAHLPS